MTKIYKYIHDAENTVAARVEAGLSDYDVITADTLRDLLLSRGLTRRMNRLIGALIDQEGLWDEAMTLSRDSDEQVAFRASWALEWAYIIRSEMIECRFDVFLADFLTANNYSVLRVYSKMLCDMLRRKAASLSDIEAEYVAEKCFGLLADAGTPVAVNVWQIELLADLMPRIEWIGENLTDIVRNMSESPGCTPAIAAAARHYFKRIRL